MKKLIIIIATVGFFTPQLKAQQDPMLSQYMFNGLYINPAYAGSHKYWSSTLSYRNQWVGLEGAPSTAIAAVDGPIPGKNMGLGLILMHDQIGVTKQNTAILNYSYQIRTGEKSKLALGINAGVSQFSAKLTSLTVWDQDQVFQNDLTSKMLPRFGVGAYHYSKRHYVGFSIPTLFAYQKGMDFNFDLSRATFLRRHYLLTAGYVFDTSKDIKIKPSVLLKYVQNAPLEADFNLSTVYKDMFWVGASYRTGDAVAIILEYQANSFFRIGYAYDITFSKLRNYSGGSHEIMIGMDFGKDLIKVKTPRYF
ncbi:MAG: type IX secretion system membrane protein PorP/SprF [Crocinitomicaceae bacterium]|nr:type IX secretion system membrane protein PorP/SprF [Crocinitomicaceae bacterium]MCF8434109.1 type IX secretion system membrane protein PorP/SprF [Crocinitomicaceae bacterium]